MLPPVADRSVNCNSQDMEVTFEFAQPFSGIVYASNYYGKDKCRWEGDGTRRLVVPVPLNTNPTGTGPYCGVKVQEVGSCEHAQKCNRAE